MTTLYELEEEEEEEGIYILLSLYSAARNSNFMLQLAGGGVSPYEKEYILPGWILR